MTSCPEAMGLGFGVIFENKQLVEIRTWAKRVDFWTCARPVQLWTTGCSRVVGSDGTVSTVEIVFLSPRVEKPKSQEGNKLVFNSNRLTSQAVRAFAKGFNPRSRHTKDF